LATTLARLTCDEPTARRLATFFDDRLGDDVAVAAFENGAGQWAVEITFTAAPDQNAIRELVESGGANPAELQFAELSEKDWVAASLAELTSVRAGRFVVHGAHHRGHFPPNLIGIEIEAALAFGTGHHGTTRGCLLALDALLKQRRGARVLDVGTGTGVLAIGAAKVLHRPIRGSDIDPVSVKTATANAHHNNVAPYLTFRLGDARRSLPWHGPFDVILANILLGTLTRMAPQLARRLAPGGFVVLSGLLPHQASAALSAYRAQGLALERRAILENWVTLVMRRRSK
jgi:ribosomal protein L11 methyltransferase